MDPDCRARNLMPTSIELASAKLGVAGRVVVAQIVLHWHARTVTVVPPPGVSMLPLSSTARLLRTTGPVARGNQWSVQLSRPVARCHDAPLSTEISTAATIPPVSA